MQYVCDAPPYTWFGIETEAEAAQESRAMNHAVEKYFRQAQDEAAATFEPPKGAAVFEQNIGRKAHIQRVMPRFLTLRDNEGAALVTAMLPPSGLTEQDMRPIIVGFENGDPYVEFETAIDILADHFDLDLPRGLCFPYARR
ncbi:MAG: hypothetical protein ACR2OV_07315 [Hyphomicrobiaceae bacterium]